jgi:hypothetical protein
VTLSQRLSHSAAAREVAVIALLAALNAYVALDLFRTEYLARMESIEAAYIGISRYILEHGFNLDWFPLWYGGIPFQNTYPPLLHLTVAITAWLLGISPAHAHHVMGALFYCAGPVFLYWMAKRLSGDWRVGAGAGLVYTLIAPSAFLSPNVRGWSGIWEPARFMPVVKYGDSPHMASVALIPLAILGIHWALEKRSPARLYLAALACAAVVLTNWLGAFGLALAVISYLLARAAADRWDPVAVLKVGAIALLAYGCAFPWIPPSTIVRIQHNAQYTIGKYPLSWGHLIYVAPALIAAGLAWWVLRRYRVSILAGFGLFFAFFSSFLVMAADYLNLSLMPQPLRYHHEMDLAWSVVLVCVAATLLRRMDRRVLQSALILLLLLAVVQTRNNRRAARGVVGPIDIHSTIEYQVAAWLQQHIPGARVFATGSIQFWLNAFADNPQVGGGFGQGIVNTQTPVVHFGVPWTIGDGADTVVWLKVYGVSAVIVSGKGGRDAYTGDWRDPEKLRGVLDEVFRDGGDVVYRVPRRSESLAHVIRAEDVAARSPVNNEDLEPVGALVRALDDAALPTAAMECARPGDCTIRADLQTGQVVYVQVTYHKGWNAYVRGERRRIERDGLGQMTVHPDCTGACEIRLIYDGGMEMKLAKAASLGCNAIGLLWIGLSSVRWARRRASIRQQF